jgi:chemotaxis protein methyltransferase WspC
MNLVAQLLKESMGLDPASVSMKTIHGAVRQRMRALGLYDIETYRSLLVVGGHEWKSLVETVVIRETWFFRDEPALKAFAALVVEEWLPKHRTETMRILSLPCSSGEEPYSLVMTLMAAGVASERFEIDAVDISERALAKAREGLYTKNSFRGKDLLFRSRFFSEQGEGFLLKPAVRERVKFSAGNLLIPEFAKAAQSYDFIFCRNLLIYFDRLTQSKAIKTLGALLAAPGRIFVGPAEQSLLLDHGFESANIPMAFACRKSGMPSHTPWPPRANRVTTLPSQWNPTPAVENFPSYQRFQPDREQNELPAHHAASPVLPDLQTAQRLLNAGRFDDAIAMCEAYLLKFGPSARAWYLLGVIRDSMSDPQARECYRRALYLEPDHYESLLQMAILSEKNGHFARARALRAHAERLKPGTRLS